MRYALQTVLILALPFFALAAGCRGQEAPDHGSTPAPGPEQLRVRAELQGSWVSTALSGSDTDDLDSVEMTVDGDRVTLLFRKPDETIEVHGVLHLEDASRELVIERAGQPELVYEVDFVDEELVLVSDDEETIIRMKEKYL